MQEPTSLRAMSVGEIIDGAIGVYRRNFGALLGSAAVVQVPLVALQTAAAIRFANLVLYNQGGVLAWTELAPSGGLFLAAMVLVMILMPLGEAALTIGVSERYLGREVGVAGAYRAAMAKWPRVLWTSLLYWVLVYLFAGLALLVLAGPFVTHMLLGGGARALDSPLSLLLIILGVLLCVGALAVLLAVAIRYMLAPSIVVALEGRWGLAAMNRSARLTAGHGWGVFVVMAVLILLVAVVTLGVSAPVQLLTLRWAQDTDKLALAQAAYQILANSLMILLRPLCVVGAILVYYDLRVRKEGFDLYMMAEALGLDLTSEQSMQTGARDAGGAHDGRGQ